jgi:hypothetical protein
MALSATFTANFSSFYDAVDKAETKLKDFGAGADKAGQRLNAMGNQFSGVKIIQDATLMVKAIEDIGGTTKLTEKELAKLGATANEAVAKMKALGMDVPKNLQKIADETKNAGKATTDWMGTLTTIAGAVGIAFSVDAIVGFVGSVFDAASAVKDLGNQWGFSTDAVQKWKGAARDAGITTEALGKSILFVTEKLSEASPAYDALLKNIGLSGPALRNMKMEDAYKEILTAISKVEDATLQYDLTLGLVGPSAKQVIGGIRDGIVEATDKQILMSKETIKRLADAEEAWGKLKDTVVIHSGEMIAAVMKATKGMTSSWGEFFQTVSDYVQFGPAVAASLAKQRAAAADAATATADLGNALKPVASHGEAVNRTMKTTAQILQELKDKEEAAKRAEDARKKALEEAKRAEEAYTRELKKHDDALDDLVNSWGGASGSGAIGKANLYLQALRNAIPIEQMSATAKLDIHKAMDAAIVSYQAAGQMAPKVMYDIWLATKNATEGVIEFSSKWKNFADIVNTQPIDLGKGFAMAPPPELTPWKDAFTDFANTLPAIFGSAMAARGGDMGKVLGQQMAAGIGAAIGPAIAAGMKGTTAQNNMATGLGIATVTQMFSEVFGNIIDAQKASQRFAYALRQMTDDMHADLVGPNSPYEDFEDLEAAANALGLTFADVWNPDGVNTFGHHLQERINEFLTLQEESDRWASEMATALEEVMAAAERYGITLEELGPAMQRQELDKQAQQLYKDWQVLNQAGLDTIVITDHMGEAVSDYVDQALAMGHEVPIAMKPMIEAMIQAGTLTDENGVAFENLEASGISFAMTMSEGFKGMIDEVKKLTDMISRSLGLAITNIPQPKITGQVTWDVPNPLVPEAQTHGADGGEHSYARGTDGFVNFGKGTPVILHGWEAVVPRGDANATVTGGGAGGGLTPRPIQITVVSQLDGREVARNQVKYIPRELALAGV